MNHVKGLLALMHFGTYGHRYQSRTIREHREELELVLDGQAICQVDGDQFVVGPGHLIWHRSGERTIYSNARSDDYECLILAFEIEPGRIATPPRLSYWDGIITPRQFCDDALAHFASHTAPSVDFCRYLYGCCKVHAHPVSTDRTLPDRVLHRALGFIAGHYRGNINVADIARAAHVSESHLHTLFRERLGRTPHQVLVQYRMEEAVGMLMRKQPIKQVVNACGFESESGFIRAFKKKYGVPPGMYRKAGRPVEPPASQPLVNLA